MVGDYRKSSVLITDDIIVYNAEINSNQNRKENRIMLMQLLMVFLGSLIGIGLSIVFCLMFKRQRSLFVLGHIDKRKTYLFRLSIRRNDLVGTFDRAVKRVRSNLVDIGISAAVLQDIEIRISGCFIEIIGKEESIAEVERLHKPSLKNRR